MITDYQSANIDLYVDQGDSYYKEFTLNYSGAPINLTGMSVVADVRRYSNTSKVYPLTAAIKTAASGIISLSLTPQQSMLFDHSRYVYQVKIIDGTDIIKVMTGQILVTAGASSLKSVSAITGNEISSYTGSV